MTQGGSDLAKQAQDLIQTGYNAVYSGTPNSPTLRRLWHEHAEGLEFPEEFGHISFVTVPQLKRMATELRLSPGDRLADLGCGLGGPAMWMARETQADLVGIDLSPVAVEEASKRAQELGLAESAQFRQGTFADTGLAENSVDGAMSEDAIQYAPDKRAFARPGSRLPPRPHRGRLRHRHLRGGLRLAGTAYHRLRRRCRRKRDARARDGRGRHAGHHPRDVDDVAAEALPAPRARRRNEKLSRRDSGLTGGRQTCRWRGSAPA